ncbi:hypothetical protein [Streptomyces flavofungini]|uniref:Uncharacterized protein n=1 Tax=Streptomyces flavofungini TaxID=68200 RepID=A0ABS0X7P1_9ACTN|nr:hypothetical protein [Streptomyces flavofungini]MBJ3809220.1 hypothetical protein [Streptomyces flavofungini]GHC76985.1 hypothetical protein GCM10010349_57280 [Streptomyces flavofungini]
MTPSIEQPMSVQAEDAIDLATTYVAVELALTTPAPPRDDILFSGGDSRPSVADQTKALLAGLPPLLTACQDTVEAWEPKPKQMVLRMIQDSHALIERRPFAPNAEQAHAYLQLLARDTRVVTALVYRGR